MRGSAVYAHLWSTPEVEALLGDEGRLGSWLDILAALARAQGELGLIPAEAADEIARRAVVENLDLAYVAEQTRVTQHSTLGLIRGVQQVVSAPAGEWFCYGATVQDVPDTGCGRDRCAVGIVPAGARRAVLRRPRARPARGAVDLGPRPPGRVRGGPGHGLRHARQDRQRGAGAAAAGDR